MDFKKWLGVNEMAVKTATRFNSPVGILPGRDGMGMKMMDRPGFKDEDRKMIHRDSPLVEKKLTAATEKYGIHWVIGYLEAPEGAANTPEDWDSYEKQSHADGQGLMNQFAKEYNPAMSVVPIKPPSPQNTIVYIKPTSRAHSFTPHEQLHNIAHALMLENPKIMAKAKQELHKAVKVLQQSAYEADPNSPPPTDPEVTIVLGRLLDLLILQRALVINPGDFDQKNKLAATAFFDFEELLFDLFPAFVNAGGQLKLYPRSAGKIAKFDRAGPIPRNQAVIDKHGVRDWVWEKIVADRAAWDNVSQIMTNIIVEMLHASTWAAKNGPIYPYRSLVSRAGENAPEHLKQLKSQSTDVNQIKRDFYARFGRMPSEEELAAQ